MKNLFTAGAIVAIAVAIFPAIPASGAAIEEFTVYPFVQYFTWEEHLGDRRILKESGHHYGLGSLVRADLLDSRLLLQVKGEVFGGEVDYDGMTQNDPDRPELSEIPVDTDVTYIGTRLEGDLGYRIESGSATLEPFVGLGYKWWLRDLQDSTAVDRNGTAVDIVGYTENWHYVYTRVGVRAGFTTSDKINFFAEGGGRYPILLKNNLELDGEGNVTLNPGEKWSGFAEAGASFDRFRVSFYYEGFRSSESSHVSISPMVSLLQPASKSDIFGMTFGWRFK